MPRIVDHQQCHHDIAVDMIPPVAAEGFLVASARNAPGVAGGVTGTVRHYFPSQKDRKNFVADVIINQLSKSIPERYPADRIQFTHRELVVAFL